MQIFPLTTSITKSSCNDIVAMSTMNQKMMRKRNHVRRREESFGAHRGVDRYLQVKHATFNDSDIQMQYANKQSTN
jgi:hypothetical protein